MERKAIFIYSFATGSKRSSRRIPKIIEALRGLYSDLTLRETKGPDDFVSACREVESYDDVVLYGGDGSLNILAHEIVSMEKKPRIAYINGGTLNDCGKPFGIRGSWKRALRIIQSGKTKEFDVVRINDRHFTYMSACGAFSDISYIASRRNKKKIGKLDYYLLAVKEAFHKKTIEVEVDGVKYKTPFLLVMNGTHVGGFHVNKRSDNCDDKIELYIVKPGLFNGLVRYAFSKRKITKLVGDRFSVKTNEIWCVDGEKAMRGDVEISIEPSKLSIYSK